MKNKTYKHINGYSQHDLEPLAEDIQNCAMKLQTDIFLSFVKTSSAIQKYLDAWLYRKPVGRLGLRVLHTLIWHHGRLTPTEISKEILRSKYAVTRIVDCLESQGFVIREPFGDDLRTRDVIITKKGINIINEYSDYLHEHVIRHVFGYLSQKQVESLNSFLVRFRDYLLTHMYDDLTVFDLRENGTLLRQ